MNFELKNREFYKKTLCLMAPVILQQLITIGVNFCDNIMIGSFGETQIAAASFGNQFYSFFQFICMGLGSGAIVMSSQFYGRRELGSLRLTAAIALRVTAVLCAVFTAAAVAWPEVILRIYTHESAVVAAGAPYMRLIGLTFLLAGISSTATYLLRSVGCVSIPLIGSSAAFFLNMFFNWVFIFGRLGAPRLELVGAAVGTVIARAFEFLFVFGYFTLRDRRFGFRMRHFALSGKPLRAQYVRFSVPVLISDTLLGLSLSLSSVIIGHVGAAMSAAAAIVNSAVQVTTVLNMGMAGAAAVTIGNTVGSGDLARARREGNTYVLLSVLFGLAVIVPLLLLEKPYLSLYSIEEETAAVAHGMLLCNCIMLPGQTLAYVVSKGILRGGGDTRFLLLADSSLVWFVSLPLGALASFVWGLSPFWIYFFLRFEYPAKGIVCLIRFLTGKWVKEVKSS